MYKSFVWLTLICWLAIVSAHPLDAEIITICTDEGEGQVGGYYGPYDPAHLPPISYPSILPPDNDPTFQNYFLGRTSTTPLDSGITTPERRAFFIFDTSSITIPDGHDILSVSIDLEVLVGGVLANFTGGVEVVEFSSTPFTAEAMLDPESGPMGPIPFESIWDTFGTSTPYGSFEFFPEPDDDDDPEPTLPGTKTIDLLPDAIDDLAMAIATGEEFIVTARLATFDPGPIEPIPPEEKDFYEFVFGLTDVVFGDSKPIAAPVLTITTIPEPGSVVLFGIGVAAIHIRRRRLK